MQSISTASSALPPGIHKSAANERIADDKYTVILLWQELAGCTHSYVNNTSYKWNCDHLKETHTE